MIKAKEIKYLFVKIVQRFKPYLSIIFAMLIIIMIGTFRIKEIPNMREFITALFRIGIILLLFFLLWKHVNIWIALFLLSIIVPQLYLCTRILTIEINKQIFLPSFDTFVTATNVFFGIIYLYCIVTLENTKKIDNFLMLAIAIVVFINVAALIYQFLYKKNPIGLTTNRNEISALLAIGMPVFLRNKWHYGLLIIILGFVLCKSIGGVIAACIGLFLYITLTLSGAWIFFLSPGIIALAIALYAKYIDAPTALIRYRIWKELIINLKNNWFFGVEYGWLKWTTLQNDKFRYINSNGKLWWYTANNEFIHLLFEKGLLFLAVIIGYIISTTKRAIECKLTIPLVALLIIIIISCFTYVFHNGVNAMLSLTWIGIIERMLRRHEYEHKKIFI